MKFLSLLLLLLALNTYAETYKVVARGHEYIFDSESMSLQSKRVNFHMNSKKCSQKLREDTLQSFLNMLTIQVKNPKNTSDFIMVNDLYIPAAHKNGINLQRFPDQFAKAILIEKRLCDKKPSGNK